MRKIGNQFTSKLLSILQFEFTFFISLLLMIFIMKFVAYPIQVDGKSMDPTLHHQDFGFASVLSLKMGELQRNDVVIVKVRDEYWVKRVIGLPGETVRCVDNVLYINNQPIAQNYLDQDYVNQEINEHGLFTNDFGDVKLKEDEVFLMGDNRVHSLDSRIAGPFKLDQIIAKDVYVLWPINHWRVVK